jgi:hypothetical protein
MKRLRAAAWRGVAAVLPAASPRRFAQGAAIGRVEQVCAFNPDAGSGAVPVVMGNAAGSLGAVFPPPSVILRQLHDLGYPQGYT